MGTDLTKNTTLQLSVTFFEIKKVKSISREFESYGDSMLIRLLCKIQKNGGSLIWNEKEKLKFCLSCPFMISTKYVDEFIQKCLEYGVFSYEEFINSSKLIFVE